MPQANRILLPARMFPLTLKYRDEIIAKCVEKPEDVRDGVYFSILEREDRRPWKKRRH
jgi:hypothetical protein